MSSARAVLRSPLLSAQTGWDPSMHAPQKWAQCLPLQEFGHGAGAVRWEALASKGMQILEPLLRVEDFFGPSVEVRRKGYFAL